MREIKFRGKSVIHKGWLYGDLITDEVKGKHIVTANCFKIDRFEIVFDSQNFWVDADTIGQFTGVQDRANTDVYEGDIIKLNGQKYVIKYFDEYALFGFSRPNNLDNPKPVGSRGSSTAYKPYVLSHFYQRRIEIIGNIHDNPELL